MSDAITPTRDVAIRVATDELTWAQRDAGLDAITVAPAPDAAISLFINLHHSNEETGPLPGGPGTVQERADALSAALANDGVQCTVEIHDAELSTLLVHLEDPEDAQALARWIVAGLPPQRAAARRLRLALHAVGTQVVPYIKGGRIMVGTATPVDVAFLYRALGGAGTASDGMAVMGPGALEDLADILSSRFRGTAKVPVAVKAEPACEHTGSNCLQLGSVTEEQARTLAACLESWAALPCSRGSPDDRGCPGRVRGAAPQAPAPVAPPWTGRRPERASEPPPYVPRRTKGWPLAVVRDRWPVASDGSPRPRMITHHGQRSLTTAVGRRSP
ncbi:hypothetical protein OG897_14585 [Streptomyces sp. NBC_00237]|uniref:hypothetical protein n=1 Tax=Streptomyces sp. NBC_00237 TaxID=2975687 RepID=UPI002252B7DB|nr:hypothetical protein [Streptomyces sp. NBC_00237]MCX5202673.1 hypothetical protein [Streptomyces sp. NBC_00237]